MPELTSIQVGNECFKKVNELKLIGLNKLESVVIGKQSFTQGNNWLGDAYGHFYLKDCERVKKLKIGCESFIDYSVCEIENVPSLEVIAIGELNDKLCFSFNCASLELKSDGDGMK